MWHALAGQLAHNAQAPVRATAKHQCSSIELRSMYRLTPRILDQPALHTKSPSLVVDCFQCSSAARLGRGAVCQVGSTAGGCLQHLIIIPPAPAERLCAFRAPPSSPHSGSSAIQSRVACRHALTRLSSRQRCTSGRWHATPCCIRRQLAPIPRAPGS